MKEVTVYTTPFCGFCARAINLLKNKRAYVTEISAAYDLKIRKEMLARSNGKTTYPQIFIGESHVGGCHELMELERAGKLDGLLNGE